MKQQLDYIYAPLPKADEDIRILLLRCHPHSKYDDLLVLRQADRQREKSSRHSYEALSYTWDEDPMILDADGRRESEEESSCLMLNGRRLAIRTNLAKALRMLRLDRCEKQCSNGCTVCTRRLWVDAVCINQADLSERNLQVSIMASIYSDAERCLAWLGEDSTERDGEASMELLRHRDRCEDPNYLMFARKSRCDGCAALNRSYGTRPNLYAIHPKLKRFLGRYFFTRLWVVQEVLLAKSTLLICGTTTLPYSTFRFELGRLVGRECSELPGGQLVRLNRHRTLTNTGMLDAMDFLRGWVCKDPRDRIGAFSSICADAYRVDYAKTVEENYLEFAKTLIQQGHGFQVFASAVLRHPVRKKGFEKGHGLPSWVPDWRDAIDEDQIGRLSATPKSLLTIDALSHILLSGGSNALRGTVNYLGRMDRVFEEGSISELSTSHTFTVDQGSSKKVSGTLKAAFRTCDGRGATRPWLVELDYEKALGLVLEEVVEPSNANPARFRLLSVVDISKLDLEPLEKVLIDLV